MSLSLLVIIFVGGCSVPQKTIPSGQQSANTGRGISNIDGNTPPRSPSPEQLSRLDALNKEFLDSGQLMFHKIIPTFSEKQGFNFGKISAELFSQLDMEFVQYWHGSPGQVFRSEGEQIILQEQAGDITQKIITAVREKVDLSYVNEDILDLDLIRPSLMAKMSDTMKSYVVRISGTETTLPLLQKSYFDAVSEAVIGANQQLAIQGCKIVLDEASAREQVLFLNNLYRYSLVKIRNQESDISTLVVNFTSVLEQLGLTRDQRTQVGSFIVDANSKSYDELFSAIINLPDLSHNLRLLAIREALNLMEKHTRANQ